MELSEFGLEIRGPDLITAKDYQEYCKDMA